MFSGGEHVLLVMQLHATTSDATRAGTKVHDDARKHKATYFMAYMF